MAVTARLRSLSSKKLRVDYPALRRAVVQDANNLGRKIVTQLATYPPPRGGRYFRTGRLGANWRFNITEPSSGINLRFSNATYYAIRVHGNETGEGQWAMHLETGWQRFMLVVQQARAEWNASLKENYKRHPILEWK